jgi:hypothetical protein
MKPQEEMEMKPEREDNQVFSSLIITSIGVKATKKGRFIPNYPAVTK